MTSETENSKKLHSFFKEEYHSLQAYVRSKIDDTADRDAEDIIQDVALKIFARADSLSPINNIAGFVYNSVRNKIIDIMRTKKEKRNIEVENGLQFMEMAQLFYEKSDSAYSEKLAIELKNAITSLKPPYRDIIIAVDFEGFTYKEISHETGIPQGTLMSRRHRALSILFKKLELKKENIN